MIRFIIETIRLRKLRKQKLAELEQSKQNLAIIRNWVEKIDSKAEEIAHTFQNGHRTEKECFSMAKSYLITLSEGDKDYISIIP